MTREEKNQIVEELSQKLASTNYFYITDASGMTVAETNAFRRLCFTKGIEYKVVKNTLIKKALETLEGGNYAAFDDKVLKGFSGILFSPESANTPARLLQEFHKTSKDKKNPKPKLKGASISFDLFIGNDQLEALATLKSKNELIGEVIGLLQSPASNVISALTSGGSKLAGILKTLEEREA